MVACNLRCTRTLILWTSSSTWFSLSLSFPISSYLLFMSPCLRILFSVLFHLIISWIIHLEANQITWISSKIDEDKTAMALSKYIYSELSQRQEWNHHSLAFWLKTSSRKYQDASCLCIHFVWFFALFGAQMLGWSFTLKPLKYRCNSIEMNAQRDFRMRARHMQMWVYTYTHKKWTIRNKSHFDLAKTKLTKYTCTNIIPPKKNSHIRKIFDYPTNQPRKKTHRNWTG